MYINFDDLPENSRIWIYQADRELKAEEQTEIQDISKKFVSNWDSHGSTVQGSFALKFNRFLILATDEDVNSPSGCSIDKSVELVRALGQKYQVDFFNRTNVTFRNGETLQTVKMNDLKTKISAGELTSESPVFDNLIQSKKELEKWEKPASETWVKRYFK